ncbi:hypothetical protein AAU57_08895 [Nonlabens sp. YIK11]|uniref:hypothetical protein n=1 Tax=Nonlabens sp. YIK11 TaxID=1453349 RepID=UPI0006DC7325|nr:hypothetical protein [Nonlabens sp. YIK11]KQC33420.1 hypothetical protein AAU57_08895 [Nonlabens sp. YIK11]
MSKTRKKIEYQHKPSGKIGRFARVDQYNKTYPEGATVITLEGGMELIDEHKNFERINKYNI